MAPPGPPPYTLDQINAMTSPEEQLRARAELKSYIARLKKEKEERLANKTKHFSTDSGSQGMFGTYQRSSGRGGFAHRGRGYGSYHPYQRSPAAHTFKNRSVTFNASDASAESSDTGDITSPRRRPINNQNLGFNSKPNFESNSLCPALTSTGVCTRHGCRYIHDPNKQALCKRWLYKDDCPMGDRCSLSHHATPNNSPTCLHFQAGRCTNETCRFAHIRVGDAAQNCEAFGQLGFCEKGDTCGELHAHECPTFANTGTCSYGNKCRLGHVHRASRMRKASRPSSVERSSHPSRNASPEHDIQDAINGVVISIDPDNSARTPHQFTQQEDFVPLDEAE